MAGQSTIVNGGFEDPDKKSEDTDNKGWTNLGQDNVEGWKTSATDGQIELGWMTVNGTSPHMVPTITAEIVSGVGASDGVQFAEAIAGEQSSIYQSLSLSAGRYYNWTVHHRGRAGVDTLALFITEDTHISHVKVEKSGTDHFLQILAWMKETGVTAPAAGNMAVYTVYSTELIAGTGFQEPSTGSYFSFASDSEHTVKFEIRLMSSDKSDWGEYTGTYFSETDQDILFVMTSFASASTKESTTSGNLIDNCSFTDSRGNNLLVNPGFDDVTITAAYQLLNGANASEPKAGIGWCSTASDNKVEIGNLEKGNAYDLDIVRNETILNAPSIREGNQFAELNANQESSLYQIVSTEPGKMYRWSLSHRGRSGVDTMALIIGPDQTYEPKKTSSSSRDQLMQIVDWLYGQTEMVLDIPEQGCSARITLYSSKFNSSGGWTLNSDLFSWNKDADHTEEWSVWIISSANDEWHDYGELESGATYDYEYVVPEGHTQSIFGFVSVNARMANGTKNVTYGNLLDNIAFKEYYYIHIKNAVNSEGGGLNIADDGSFVYDSTNAGWAFSGSDLTIHLKPGSREIIGTYINGVFIPIKDTEGGWQYDAEHGEYVYHLENISTAVQVEIVYVAEQVVYDSRSDYVYQYLDDGKGNYSGGCEVKLGPEPDSLTEYTSHAPQHDDGWEFVGWKYISPKTGTVYMLEAEHKVVYVIEEVTTEVTNEVTNEVTTVVTHKETFAIYQILPNDETKLIVDNIPYDEGITFFAEWEYRQRVVSKTFNKQTSEYEISAEGGSVELTLVTGGEAEKSDYPVNSEKVGEELVASDSAYINVSAHKNVGYHFNGWHDSEGNLVSNSISYTYQVGVKQTVELFAYFEPAGYNITIRCAVDDSTFNDRYFAINCTFTRLRNNKVYDITGLNTDPITVDGATVTNPTLIRADGSGNSTVTVYLKPGQTANLVFLPENCVYSVLSRDYKDEGFNVRGEVNSGVLKAADTVDLKYYSLSQAVKLEAGKQYAGVISGLSPDLISITKNSSYTLDVVTRYNPQIYTGLNVSLCFYDTTGTAKAFAPGTRILMIDFTDKSNPRYFQYIVPDPGDPVIKLEQFRALATYASYERNPSGSGTISERLVFLIDYVGCESVESGRIALVYNDAGDELIQTVKPDQRAVEIGEDTTQLTVTPGAQESVANIGRFALNVTVGKSTYTVNTAYDGEKYAIRLSLDGGFPVGSYVEVDGVRYYSNNGCITVSPLSGGDFTFVFDSPLPIRLTDGKATLTATLLPAVSTTELGSEEKRTTVSLNGVDAENCAIDAEPSDTALSPGHISQAEITLKYAEIDSVRLTVSRKDGNSYSAVVRDVNISLPTGDDPFTVDLGNGFDADPGETYLFAFVGYIDGFPVCSDVCCVVIGY